MKQQALRDSSVTSHMISKTTMGVNRALSNMAELKRKALVDKTDAIVKDLSWLLLDTSLLGSGLNFFTRSHNCACIDGFDIIDAQESPTCAEGDCAAPPCS